jgi:predicted glycoside hydrolase/deacetylase ChbG (UPF0249 family)
VSFQALAGILTNEVDDGVYELGVHPGYQDPDVRYVYGGDREHELRALTDPCLRELLAALDIRLVNYHALELTRTISPPAAAGFTRRLAEARHEAGQA